MALRTIFGDLPLFVRGQPEYSLIYIECVALARIQVYDFWQVCSLRVWRTGAHGGCDIAKQSRKQLNLSGKVPRFVHHLRRAVRTTSV